MHLGVQPDTRKLHCSLDPSHQLRAVVSQAISSACSTSLWHMAGANIREGATNPRGRRAGEEGGKKGALQGHLITNITKKLEEAVETGLPPSPVVKRLQRASCWHTACSMGWSTQQLCLTSQILFPLPHAYNARRFSSLNTSGC